MRRLDSFSRGLHAQLAGALVRCRDVVARDRPGFTHGGAVSGFIARNTFVPQTRSAVVVIINNEDGPLANALVEHAMKAVLPERAAQVPVTTGPSEPQRRTTSAARPRGF